MVALPRSLLAAPSSGLFFRAVSAAPGVPMLETLVGYAFYAVPVVMIGAGFVGVDAFLAATGLAIVGLAGGSIGYSLGWHDIAAFALPIKTMAIIFVVGLIGLPIARWTEERKAGIR